jgi:hypothetical protein
MSYDAEITALKAQVNREEFDCDGGVRALDFFENEIQKAKIKHAFHVEQRRVVMRRMVELEGVQAVAKRLGITRQAVFRVVSGQRKT